MAWCEAVCEALQHISMLGDVLGDCSGGTRRLGRAHVGCDCMGDRAQALLTDACTAACCRNPTLPRAVVLMMSNFKVEFSPSQLNGAPDSSMLPPGRPHLSWWCRLLRFSSSTSPPDL